MRIHIIGFISAIALLTGCATRPVIGPVSYWTSQQNQKARIQRAALASPNLNAEQRSRVFHMTAHSSNPNEIAISLGVDVLELVRGEYTTMEVVKQAGGVVGDVTLYTILYNLLKGLADSGSTSGDDYSIRSEGNNNVFNVTQGSNNDGTAANNQAASGGTGNFSPDESSVTN